MLGARKNFHSIYLWDLFFGDAGLICVWYLTLSLIVPSHFVSVQPWNCFHSKWLWLLCIYLIFNLYADQASETQVSVKPLQVHIVFPGGHQLLQLLHRRSLLPSGVPTPSLPFVLCETEHPTIIGYFYSDLIQLHVCTYIVLLTSIPFKDYTAHMCAPMSFTASVPAVLCALHWMFWALKLNLLSLRADFRTCIRGILMLKLNLDYHMAAACSHIKLGEEWFPYYKI